MEFLVVFLVLFLGASMVGAGIGLALAVGALILRGIAALMETAEAE